MRFHRLISILWKGDNIFFLSCDLGEFRRRDAPTDFAASQTIVCLAHCPLGSAFHPRHKSVRSPYAHEWRSRVRARARRFLWDHDRAEPRARAITERRRRMDPRWISTTWRSFHSERTSYDQEQGNSIFRKLIEGLDSDMKREMTHCCASPVIAQVIQLKCHDGQLKFSFYPRSKRRCFKEYCNVNLFYSDLPSCIIILRFII